MRYPLADYWRDRCVVAEDRVAALEGAADRLRQQRDLLIVALGHHDVDYMDRLAGEWEDDDPAFSARLADEVEYQRRYRARGISVVDRSGDESNERAA